METSRKDNKYFRAKERVEQIRKFYSGLVSYTVGISLLAALNYYIDGWNHPWFLWAALGWGIGLTVQAAKAYNVNPFFGKEWEERKIEQLMKEEERLTRWE